MSNLEQIDLTYITERILAIFCPADCPEPDYTHSLQKIVVMLQAKHRDDYMLINLSRRHSFLSHLNHKILDTGWLDSLAPGLTQIFRVCTLMENWLQTHSKHVLVLHCRGSEGLLGVLLSSYIHFSNMSASADLSLDYFAMRRFYTDKLAAWMTPSQKRYVWMMSSMLKDSLKMTPSPTFLLCVVLHGLLGMNREGGCCLFLRVYQSLQAVCTSAIYDVTAAETDQLHFVLQPAQLLTGDIMVVCYNKHSRSASRRLVFRLQFHMGQVHGHTLTFFKADLDWACQDPGFPEGAKVELLFGDSPEKITGRELWHNGHSVTVTYDTLDPLVRRDSYQDVSSMESADLHRLDVDIERAPSPSSDSGLSVASQAGLGSERGAAPDRSPPRLDPDIVPPLLEVMAELAARGRGSPPLAGGTVDKDQKSGVQEDNQRRAAPRWAGPGPGSGSGRRRSRSSEDVADGESSTHRWVRQQQMVDGGAESHPEVDGGRRVGRASGRKLPRQTSRGPAAQRRLWPGSNGHTHDSPPHGQDLASLTTDVDESIEQLNKLILDLDPTFVPVSTSCSPLTRSASLQSHELSQRGSPHLSDWRWQSWASNVVDGAAVGPRSPAEPSSPAHPWCSSPHQGPAGALNTVPPTPAFPVSPPTPYDSRSFLKGLTSSGSSLTEGELFRPAVLASPAAQQGVFDSTGSMSSDSPLARTHSSAPDVCPSRIPNSSQASPSASVSALSSPPGGSDGGPGCHRGPDGADPSPLSSLSSLLLGNGLEHSLLEAVESLESLESLNLRGPGALPPLLPEKRRTTEGAAELDSHSPSLSGFSSPHSSSSSLSVVTASSTPDQMRAAGGAWSPGADCGGKQQDTVKFVQDTSKFWYKSDISREQAVAVLKDKEPGSFIVRDSHSFRGAYGLAVKVATPPPSVLQHGSRKGDPTNELVRHFLIECSHRGVRLKGCPNEPYFGSLTALVCQHSITPLALPCKLILPDKDPLEETNESTAQTATNSAAELLKQGAACNVWYLGSVALESLTGHQAVQKAATQTLSVAPPSPSTVVHFKVSAQGITLTDNQRKLFFRKHYAVNTVIFCSLDPQGRRWPQGSGSTAKIFGFVARKSQSDTDNECHLFAEHDPEQPASAIVNFVSKVMIGSHKQK